ncbi:MAG: quinone-dependent dihydroorotate dehydrogenase [Arenicellales bacterium]
MSMYALARSLLFRLDPETAHRWVVSGIGLAGRIHPVDQYVADLWRGRLPPRPVRAMGLTFPNPVGVAAGLDKDVEAFDGLALFGFGFIELGTVTPLAQSGNPKPRMFRLIEHGALINRMGFNSKGLGHFLNRLGKTRQLAVTGINLGKNAKTPIENAVADYINGLRAVYTAADYVTINISSPNTQDLRSLQQDAALDRLLEALKEEQRRLASDHQKYTPIAIKIAPDLNDEQLVKIASAVVEHEVDGLVATNTTTARAASVASHCHAGESGGLSGRPLADTAREKVIALRQSLPQAFPIIGAGGIDDADSAIAMLDAGANLIQIYTGLIYRGPSLLREILKGMENASPQ